MAINRIEIKNFLVFKGNFTAEFCPGINVLIGGNATGKTTLLKTMYLLVSQPAKIFNDLNSQKAYCGAVEDLYHEGAVYEGALGGLSCFSEIVPCISDSTLININNNSIIIDGDGVERNNTPIIKQDGIGEDTVVGHHRHEMKKTASYQIGHAENAVYIPEKDILEHAKGLLTFIDEKQTGFSQIYREVLVKSYDTPTQNQTETQKMVGEKIVGVIGGNIQWVPGDGVFYTVRTDGKRIPFAYEASGYKKLGFLGLLVTNGQLENGSVLFWDEPENSLNPELVPVLVDILLALARNGVQIFLATHNYHLARYFDVRKDKSVPVMFHNLSQADDGQIICRSSPEYMKLPDNLLEKAGEDLFDAVVANAMGVRNDE